MKPHQIENWALDVIERTLAGSPNEDSRVELKREWPAPPNKAARQIAGHANAARGASILWLVGIDQVKGIVGAQHNELASWYPQITAQFEGLAPSMQDLNVPIDGKTVVALHFETDRAPFLVKNPKYGEPDGGPVKYEVPWREGSSTRTAQRSDLLLMLSPQARLPQFEVLEGSITMKQVGVSEDMTCAWDVVITLYAHKDTTDLLAIPFHQCEVACDLGHNGHYVEFSETYLLPDDMSANNRTINSTYTELLLYGPGQFELHATGKTDSSYAGKTGGRSSIPVKASLRPVNSQYTVSINVTLHRAKLPFPGNKGYLGDQKVTRLWTLLGLSE